MGGMKNGLAALLFVMLTILPSLGYPQDCGDLAFTLNTPDPICGANFSIGLDNSYPDPFNYWENFSNATLSLPSGSIFNVSRPLFVNLSAEGGSVEWLLACSTPGTYMLNVSVPNGTQICVNNLSIPARAPTSPNISVSAPSPVTLIALYSNAFNVTLSNVGNGSAVNANTTFSVPNATVSPPSISRSTLVNGSSALQAFSITPSMCGNSSNTVYVNYFDEVGIPMLQSSFISNMSVTGPYLTVSNPSFSDSSPQEQSAITITVTINNSVQNNCNYSTSNNFTVSFYNGNPSSGGTLIQANTFSPLSANSNATTSASWTVPSAGTFTIYSVVSLEEPGFNSSYTSSASVTGTSRPTPATTSIFGTSGSGMTSEPSDSPPTVESACKESWSCTEWGECSIGTFSQARTCTDANQCNTAAGKPIESQSCTPQIAQDAANAISQASGVTTEFAKSLLEQAKAAYEAKDYALAAELARKAIEAEALPAAVTTTTTPTGFATFATAGNAATVAAVLAILAAAYYLWTKYGGKKIFYSFKRK